MPTARSRPALAAIVAASLVAAVVPSVPPAAAAAAAPGPELAELRRGPDQRPAATPVTLITGDRVLLRRAADGTPSAVVQGDGDHYARRVGDDLYVIPTEAQDALAADRLDLELFNVTGLVEQRYDDRRADSLPVIVEGAVPQVRGAEPDRVELASIDATAVALDKEALDATYERLLGDGRRATTVDKVWLDARLQPTATDLDPATGVEQSGAPPVWRRGFDGTGTTVAVLDTGYDAEHPDLAGQVVGSRDFTGEGIEDFEGHGTHVASTVAGSGAADRTKTGMAPGADLLIGKVLGFGGGQMSSIVEGMEWAVAEGADVVNMSFGSGEPTDCTDPVAQATSNLARTSSTLFVVAAGNAAAKQTVSSPGCVEEVLTVGAVDADGETAPFSSRGSVVGTHDVKPDIAAPGVDIVAAQAGSPGGVHYIGMSGTSMATPHVVGAAALVRQARPGWSPQQVKAALVAAVKRAPEGTVYDQGAGELWTPDAVDAAVTSEPSVELAEFDWPHGRDERATRRVTYTNTSSRPVRLSLRLEDLTGADGRPVPGALITLKDRSVIVPARGSTTVPVAARGDVGRLRDGAYGEIGARLVARTSGPRPVRLTTAVGLWLEPETVTVTVRAVDRAGAPATSGYLDLTDLHQPSRAVHYFTGEDITLRLRAGSYFFGAFIQTAQSDGTSAYAYLSDPDRRFTEDTTLRLDARSARPVSVRGDRPMALRSGSIGVQRSFDGWVVGDSLFAQADPDLYVATTDRVRDGDVTFGTYLRTFAPSVPTEDSPYVYNLAFVERDRISADQSHRVADRGLGSATEQWHSQRHDWTADSWTSVVPDDGTGPFYTSGGDPVRAPGTRTAYFTPGVRWQEHAASAGYRAMPEVWFDPERTYRAGQHRSTEWLRLPTMTAMAVDEDGRPTRIAERQGSLVGFAFPTWQDPVEGRIGMGGFGDIGVLRLWADGEFVGDSAWPSGQADIGDGEVELKVEVLHERWSRHDFWELARGTISRFTFRSARPRGDEVVPLPVAVPHYDAPVDDRNLAPASRGFPVTIGLRGQAGYDPRDLRRLTAKVSFDLIEPADENLEGHDWVEVPVRKRDGRWVALVDNSADAGGVASLWIAAEDGHDTRIEQFVLGLYGVE